MRYRDSAQILEPVEGAASFGAQVLVPASQALLTGAALGLAAGAGAWAFWEPALALPVGLTAGSLSAAAAWLILLDSSRSLLRVLSYDLRGEAEPPADTLISGKSKAERLILVNPPRQADRERSRFENFVRAAAVGSDTRRLEGLGYSRQEIAGWRDTLLRLGAARWRSRDPRRGWELSEPVEAILERLCAV